ncbi:MAG: VRR-NUC domain-containing protein [Pseudomonadota bacterium]
MPDAPNPLYYLSNFQQALAWLRERYADLLSAPESQFMAAFGELPVASQALLVRLVMRKGALFRRDKLTYAEIGAIDAAVAPLLRHGWIDAQPELTLPQVFALLTRPELEAFLPPPPTGLRKNAWLEMLQSQPAATRPLSAWTGDATRIVYHVTIAPLCTRLRLLFFGNFRQDWAEFVLADLGVFKYEVVDLPVSSRAFHCRADIEHFYALHECRQKLHDGVDPTQVLEQMPGEASANEWLAQRRARLLYHIASQYEREGDLEQAAIVHARSAHPESAVRAIRISERLGNHLEAHAACVARLREADRPAEREALQRILTRVSGRLGLPTQSPRPRAQPERLDLLLPAPPAAERVEQAVRTQLGSADAPVFYVENALIPSLFALLCWPAIFAPVPGAFFHRFQSGPADLLSPRFYAARKEQFDACLARLDGGDYRAAIRATLQAKHGTQAPFVYWGVLTQELLDLALDCVPPSHLRLCFERLLENVQDNRNGLPDLIQFWPAEKRYRLIEVKGPGDRLQHNQRRWLAFCQQHGIPVAVCHARRESAPT